MRATNTTSLTSLAHVPLTEVPVGTRVRIRQLTSQPELCSRLREMGLGENSVIRPVNRGNGNIICEVCNTRVGLNNMIARSIVVTAV